MQRQKLTDATPGDLSGVECCANYMADPSRAINIEDLRQLARRRLPRAIFDFFDGGAEDEVTLRENRAAFERLRLLPRVLVDVAEVDTRVKLFGVESKLPLAIAPTGGISAGRPAAEILLPRTAKAYGIPFTLATPAAARIERGAAQAGGPRLFQLHLGCDPEFLEKPDLPARHSRYQAV